MFSLQIIAGIQILQKVSRNRLSLFKPKSQTTFFFVGFAFAVAAFLPYVAAI